MITAERARELRAFIVKAAQSLEDAVAVKCPELYAKWSGDAVEYAEGYKVRFNDKVYKVITAHTSQAEWTPEVAASLFTVIDEEHVGTIEDPIPYSHNMEIFADKYYVQNDVVYKCIRDSGAPLHHDLSALVGVYVEVA